MGGGPPSFPQGFTCLVVLWIRSDRFSFSFTGLLPSAEQLSSYLQLRKSSIYDLSATPRSKIWVWALSLSLAATQEIDVSFSSSGYLDVSVPRVPFNRLCIHLKILRHYPKWVSPFGNLWIKGCLHLPKAYRSLPRPSSAPSAKASALRS